MPRLRSEVTVDLSDSGESATEQLLAEAAAPPSLSKSDHAAERSANLLNAARATIRVEEPTKSNGKLAKGKLKRPNSGTTKLRPSARGGDIYDVPVSPKKSSKATSQARSKFHKIPIVGNTKQKASRPNGEASTPLPLVAAKEREEATVPTPSDSRKSGRLARKQADVSDNGWDKRPEGYKPPGRHSKTRAEDAKPKPVKPESGSHHQKEGRKSSESHDIALNISKRKSVDAIPQSERRSKTSRTDNGKGSAERVSHRVSPEKNSIPRPTASHPRVVIPIRTPSKDAPKAASDIGRPEPADESTTTSGHQDRLPAAEASSSASRKEERHKTKVTGSAGNRRQHASGIEKVPNSIDEEFPTTVGHQEELAAVRNRTESSSKSNRSRSATKRGKLRPSGKGEKKATAKVPDTSIVEETSPAPVNTVLSSEEEAVALVHTEEILLTSELEVPGSVQNEGSDEDNEAFDDNFVFSNERINDSEEEALEDELFDADAEPLETVSRFIDSCGQDGSCQTQLGKDIKKLCRKGSRKLGDPDVRPAEVEDMCISLSSRLHTVRHQKTPSEKTAFKLDALGHLFHCLATFLEAVYSWAQEYHGEPLFSLSALNIIVPLLGSYLWFADFIRKWGGKAVKDDEVVRNTERVERGFLEPLRRIEEEHSLERDRLERIAIRQQRNIEQKEEEEAEQRRAAIARRLRDRKELWQHLHIYRQQCETSLDPQRRRHLKFKPLEIEELDANGVRFERENVFHERSTPFMHRRPLSDDQWNDRHSYALAQGLEEYAGPRVFEHIFENYCREGGPLRDFNVTEITGQAACFRAKLIEKFQLEGWPVQDWIKQIPILP